MKVEHKREECIGCGACSAICPDLFEMGKDNKANLKGAKKEGNIFVLEIDESKKKCAKDASESCPVNIIILK